MNYVRQEDGFGCGVACVANLLGVSYQQALQLFYNPNHDMVFQLSGLVSPRFYRLVVTMQMQN
jgi:hypothetical protein